MKKYITIAFFFAIVSFVIVIPSYDQVLTINNAEQPTYLFVLSGTSGKMEGDKLTLNGVPNVVYFSDRPSRIAGHKSVSDFVGFWNNSPQSMKTDPPNATLSMLDDESVKNVVIELISAEAEGDSVTFIICVLEGNISDKFGTASLFVDSFCLGCVP